MVVKPNTNKWIEPLETDDNKEKNDTSMLGET